MLKNRVEEYGCEESNICRECFRREARAPQSFSGRRRGRRGSRGANSSRSTSAGTAAGGYTRVSSRGRQDRGHSGGSCAYTNQRWSGGEGRARQEIRPQAGDAEKAEGRH